MSGSCVRFDQQHVSNSLIKENIADINLSLVYLLQRWRATSRGDETPVIKLSHEWTTLDRRTEPLIPYVCYSLPDELPAKKLCTPDNESSCKYSDMFCKERKRQ